jgi:hypothetical protein
VNRRSLLATLAAIPVALGLSAGKAQAAEPQPALSIGDRELMTFLCADCSQPIDDYGLMFAGQGRHMHAECYRAELDATLRADPVHQETFEELWARRRADQERRAADEHRLAWEAGWDAGIEDATDRARLGAMIERRAAEAAGRAFPEGAPYLKVQLSDGAYRIPLYAAGEGA